MSNKEAFESFVTKLNWNNKDDFRLWPIQDRAVCCDKNLYTALKDDTGNSNKIENALSIIRLCFGDNPLKTIQERESAKAVWIS